METEPTSWRDGIAQPARFLPGDRVQRLTFLVLLALAAVLRLWDLPHIPFTHDEMSALVRVYPTLAETVGKGVIEQDTHPPGVQVFEWAWTRLFGMSAAAVKLPFILMALAALLLLYRFAFAWCGGTVALVLTALLATLQYTVMYGQIARPYAAGLFTTALLADQLTRWLAHGTRRALVFTALAAVLSAYVHHFALMLAALMMLTGLVLSPPGRRKAFLIAAGVAALLYVPNLPITFGQFGLKGLDEWLAAPTPIWIADHLWWIAHCSTPFAAAWCLLLVVAAALRIRHRAASGPVWAFTLFWGLLPLAVGYAYSVWRSPVLQYSVLIFSFPYLLLGLLAGLRHLRPAWAPALALTLASLSTFTLVFVRQHYQVFYHSIHAATAQGILAAQDRPGRLALHDAPAEMVDFLLCRLHADPATTRCVDIRGLRPEQLDSVLERGTTTEVFYACTPRGTPEHLARIQSFFPFLKERHDMAEGQTFLFSAKPARPGMDDTEWSGIITPEAVRSPGWTVDPTVKTVQDSAAKYGSPAKRWDLNGLEYGLLFERPVYEIAQGDNDLVEARMDVEAASGNGLKLVMELKQGERTTHYRSQAMAGTDGTGTILTSIRLADLPGHGKGDRLRVYVWNEGARPARIASMEVRVRQGDPWLYGLLEPLKGPLVFP